MAPLPLPRDAVGAGAMAAATTASGGDLLRSLPHDALGYVLRMLGARGLAQLACTARWYRARCTSDDSVRLVLAAAAAARMEERESGYGDEGEGTPPATHGGRAELGRGGVLAAHDTARTAASLVGLPEGEGNAAAVLRRACAPAFKETFGVPVDALVHPSGEGAWAHRFVACGERWELRVVTRLYEPDLFGDSDSDGDNDNDIDGAAQSHRWAEGRLRRLGRRTCAGEVHAQLAHAYARAPSAAPEPREAAARFVPTTPGEVRYQKARSFDAPVCLMECPLSGLLRAARGAGTGVDGDLAEASTVPVVVTMASVARGRATKYRAPEDNSAPAFGRAEGAGRADALCRALLPEGAGPSRMEARLGFHDEYVAAVCTFALACLRTDYPFPGRRRTYTAGRRPQMTSRNAEDLARGLARALERPPALTSLRLELGLGQDRADRADCAAARALKCLAEHHSSAVVSTGALSALYSVRNRLLAGEGRADSRLRAMVEDAIQVAQQAVDSRLLGMVELLEAPVLSSS